MLRILLILGTTALCALAQTADFDVAREDLSVYLTTKYIEDQGYVAETHHVTTEDGYILEMHRIPYPRNQNQPSPGTRPVAFLMHGLTGASLAYVFLGHEHSVAYNLADAGFDVWMGNQRGSKNSRHHITLNPDDPSDRLQFFDFSWEEIGMLDLPAMIDYILKETGREKLHYIGHSQGGTVFFVLGSMRPEYNSKIASAHLLAGVGYQQYFPDPDLASAAVLTDIIYSMAVNDGLVELFPPNTTEVGGYSALDACLGDVAYKTVCNQIGVRKYSIMRADDNDDIISNNGTDTGNTDIGDNIGNNNNTNIEENNGSDNETDIDISIDNGNSADIDDSNSSSNSTDVDDSISNGTDTDNNTGNGDGTDIEDINGSGNGSDSDDNGVPESEGTEDSESSFIDDYFTSSDAVGGGALKQVAHYGQNIRDKAFRRWNYGFFGNLGNYASINPPSYNLGLITCNVTMHYTVSDELLDERDVLDMAADMPNVAVRQVSRTSFLHGDFAGALDAKVLVTNYVIEAILYVEENLPVEEEEDISDSDEGTVVVVEESTDSEDDVLDSNEDLTEDTEGEDENDLGGNGEGNGNEDGNGNQDGNDNEGNENTDPVVEPVTDSSNSVVLSMAFKVYLIMSSIFCIFLY